MSLSLDELIERYSERMPKARVWWAKMLGQERAEQAGLAEDDRDAARQAVMLMVDWLERDFGAVGIKTSPDEWQAIRLADAALSERSRKAGEAGYRLRWQEPISGGSVDFLGYIVPGAQDDHCIRRAWSGWGIVAPGGYSYTTRVSSLLAAAMTLRGAARAIDLSLLEALYELDSGREPAWAAPTLAVLAERSQGAGGSWYLATPGRAVSGPTTFDDLPPEELAGECWVLRADEVETWRAAGLIDAQGNLVGTPPIVYVFFPSPGVTDFPILPAQFFGDAEEAEAWSDARHLDYDGFAYY